MNAPQLTLKSVSSVDVELQIAGPGARSYAFIIRSLGRDLSIARRVLPTSRLTRALEQRYRDYPLRWQSSICESKSQILDQIVDVLDSHRQAD